MLGVDLKVNQQIAQLDIKQNTDVQKNYRKYQSSDLDVTRPFGTKCMPSKACNK